MIISKDLFLLGDQDYLRLPKEEKRVTMSSSSTMRPNAANLDQRGDSVLVRLSSEQRQQLPHKPVELTFANVTVHVEKRRVLQDVSGVVKPGQMLAVMGPSGSGKTTLLNCLAGRTKPDKGSIRLNRENLNKKSKRKICYVLQQDIFFPDLTLRQTLQYAAMLRLPDSMSYKQKMLYVDHIIAELDLINCQHTIMGDYMKRGLSGGEKKRANIACELLTNPALMLLDEPTSGLDSHAANSLMSTLKRHAIHENKTVVVTVHQPSSQIFHMFDELLLLCNGQTAYFGDVDQVVNFFGDIGLRVKPHYNPADFILEQIKGSEETKEKILKASRDARSRAEYPHELQSEFYANSKCDRYHADYELEHRIRANGHPPCLRNAPDLCPSDVTRPDSDSSMRAAHDLRSAVRPPPSPDDGSRLYTAVPAKEQEGNAWLLVDNQSHTSSSGSSSDYDFSWQWPTCFWTQFKVLSQRNFQEARPRMLSKLNWVQTVALGLMAGLLWFNLPRTEHAIHDIQGWMFFSTTYWMLFCHFGALYSLPAEREVINKERQSGAYRLSAYYLAKMVGELPLTITLPAVYHLISYPLLGSYSSKAFFSLLAILLLNTVVAQSVGFFIGACCKDMQVSITISAIYTLATQLFGGYLATNIPPWFVWMKRLSMIHYAYQNMQIVEFSEGAPIECAANSKYEACQSSRYIPATDILQMEGCTLPLWLNSLILLVFLVVFRTLGYVALRYFRRLR